MESALLYDLDGTLVSTEPANVTAVSQVLLTHGVRVENPLVTQIVLGHAWPEIWQKLTEHGLQLGQAEFIQAALATRAQLLPSGPPPLPVARLALDRHAQSHLQAIVSGATRQEVELALTSLDAHSRIKLYVSAEDVAAGKPAPDG